jgi:hypothetical protein
MTILSFERQIRQSLLSVDPYFWTKSLHNSDVKLSLTNNTWLAEILINDSQNCTNTIRDLDKWDLLFGCRNTQFIFQIKIWDVEGRILYDVAWNGKQFSLEKLSAPSLEKIGDFLPSCCKACIKYMED